MENWPDSWYLLRCKENYWRVLLDVLSSLGIETCCPLVHERRQRKDRKSSFRLISSPAFPGYIFVHIDLSIIHTSTVASIPGVIDFVRFGKDIAAVSASEIDVLRHAEYKALYANEENYECVHLTPQLLEEVEAIYTNANPCERVGKLLNLITTANRKRNVSKNKRKQHLCIENHP
ncbi:hypothetical protein NOF85_004609 [Salmonella enterica]|nr:hypothetical protein [Salmonella enterica]